MTESTMLHGLKRWWYIALAGIILGLAASLVYVRVAPAQYTSRADVLLAVNGRNAVDLSSGSNFAQQQARNLSVLVGRQRVLAPVVRRLDLPESAAQLGQRVTATVPTNTSIVTIEVTYSSADSATAIANATADSLAQAASQLLPATQGGGTSVNVRTVYQDTPPAGPSSPVRLTATLLGTGAGLVVGLLLVLLLEVLVPRRSLSEAAEARIPNWSVAAAD